MLSQNALGWGVPGGGGGGLVGVPVLGGRAGGVSELLERLSSLNRFLLVEELAAAKGSAPFDWSTETHTHTSSGQSPSLFKIFPLCII